MDIDNDAGVDASAFDGDAAQFQQSALQIENDQAELRARARARALHDQINQRRSAERRRKRASDGSIRAGLMQAAAQERQAQTIAQQLARKVTTEQRQAAQQAATQARQAQRITQAAQLAESQLAESQVAQQRQAAHQAASQAATQATQAQRITQAAHESARQATQLAEFQ
jgi:hypothetical protein